MHPDMHENEFVPMVILNIEGDIKLSRTAGGSGTDYCHILDENIGDGTLSAGSCCAEEQNGSNEYRT
jgi:hypothetical protein